ncbi:hypothetical protein DFP72DRAFT_1179287 [Ephemerocybe angulata]|uniref:Uncharacterized protein n=1 Tax=Ephemerocybe angulata TaxID=980116 RepID=A0A8H6LSR1_9AGAR|nr:hypothetical protein DFP72DRAFT_1179287 [Tulosesus angulatus]
MPYELRKKQVAKKGPELPSFRPRARKTPRKSNGAPAPRRTLAVPPATAGAPHASEQPALKRMRTQEPDRMSDSIVIVRSGNTIEANRFCSLCANGGTHSVCSKCDGSVCQDCVKPANNIAFTCPNCHNEGPYPHKLTYTSRSRGSTKMLDSSPLCIIAFRLAGSPDDGSAEHVAYHRVYPYFRGNVALITVWFNLEDDGAQIRIAVGDLIDTLTSHDFAQFNRFVVTITTHSDPGRGDLHIIPKNQGSLTVSNLMEFLLPAGLQKILGRGSEKDHNLCVFFTCGAAVKRVSSFEDIRSLEDSGLFAEVIGFTQKDLQPELLSSWFSELVYSYFVLNYNSSEPVLKNHHVTGSHTGIVSFRKNAIYEYAWVHPIRQPFGKPVVAQCPECGHLNSWTKSLRQGPKSTKKVAPLKDGYDLRCKTHDCEAILSCDPPSTNDWIWVGQPLLDGPHGAWLRFDRTLCECIPTL